ncbi:TrfB-related DNA-binding protein [Delftia sp. GW456-R20]|uniref:TrfB-related DNA-binding protein n=1 Tax=Delftia sp. GW456-R20 TaxID=1827145 RepID=UPI0009EDDB3F
MPLMTEAQFQKAAGYARVLKANQEAAFKYLVNGVPMAVIARDMKCSRQNIHRVVKRIQSADLERQEYERRKEQS